MTISSGRCTEAFRSLVFFPGATALAVFVIGNAAFAAPCASPPAPTSGPLSCITAVNIPPDASNSSGKLTSFDISFINTLRSEYLLGDRSNRGVDVIDVNSKTFKTRYGGAGIFVGFTGNNNTSGPNGVVAFNNCIWAGDGNSTLRQINETTATIFAAVATGGSNRLDELAINRWGTQLLGANNADDPAFATLFNTDPFCNRAVSIIGKVSIDTTIMPTGFGLSMEQPFWDDKIGRFTIAVPIIANNPSGCNYGQNPGAITCGGAVAYIDPSQVGSTPLVLGAFDQTTLTGVLPLHGCNPNGNFLGLHGNTLLGCTPNNAPLPNNAFLQVLNVKSQGALGVIGITGADEVYFNGGGSDDKHGAYWCTGTSGDIGGPTLGVVDGETNFLVTKTPVSSASHSVACAGSLIFDPQTGSDTTGNAAKICGGSNGCVAVYKFKAPHDEDEDDEHRERHEAGLDVLEDLFGQNAFPSLFAFDN